MYEIDHFACTYIYMGSVRSIVAEFLADYSPTTREEFNFIAKLDINPNQIAKYFQQNPQIESITFDFQNKEIDKKFFVDISSYSVRVRLTKKMSSIFG